MVSVGFVLHMAAEFVWRAASWYPSSIALLSAQKFPIVRFQINGIKWVQNTRSIIVKNCRKTLFNSVLMSLLISTIITANNTTHCSNILVLDSHPIMGLIGWCFIWEAMLAYMLSVIILNTVSQLHATKAISDPTVRGGVGNRMTNRE